MIAVIADITVKDGSGEQFEAVVAELAEKGGIEWSEMVAVLEDRPWHWMSVDDAAERLEELFADWVFTLPKQMTAAAQRR